MREKGNDWHEECASRGVELRMIADDVRASEESHLRHRTNKFIFIGENAVPRGTVTDDELREAYIESQYMEAESRRPRRKGLRAPGDLPPRVENGMKLYEELGLNICCR